nr:unnamed protein product [Spirometra erinaceieuropaei]
MHSVKYLWFIIDRNNHHPDQANMDATKQMPSPKEATTIFAADEDIQEGQLIVFLLLHRKLNVREDGIELFLERQHLIPFADSKVSSTYRAQHFGLWCRKTSDSSLCRTASAMNPEIDEPIGVPFTCS